MFYHLALMAVGLAFPFSIYWWAWRRVAASAHQAPHLRGFAFLIGVIRWRVVETRILWEERMEVVIGVLRMFGLPVDLDKLQHKHVVCRCGAEVGEEHQDGCTHSGSFQPSVMQSVQVLTPP